MMPTEMRKLTSNVELMRKILSEDEVHLISRRLGKVVSPIFEELSSHYGLNIEDSIRFQAVATRLREARERRSMDLKAASKALSIPQYRLRDIEGCHLKNLKSPAVRQYIDFLGLGRWFARWFKANSKLAARLGIDQDSDSK
jgi:Helix-turn-helix domain